MNDIIERIGNLLTTRFGVSPAEFSADAALRDLDLDSLGLVEFELSRRRSSGSSSVSWRSPPTTPSPIWPS
jgi:hypothetical protein